MATTSVMEPNKMGIAEDHDEPPQWERLPPHVLLSIYRNLNKYDQCSMSLVCRNWENSFDEPELWRQISLPLFLNSEVINVEPLHSEVQLIEKYGHMVKRLNLTVTACRCTKYEKIKKELDLLCSKAQLESVSIEGSLGRPQILHPLFKTQDNLQSLELKGPFDFMEFFQLCHLPTPKNLKNIRMKHVKWNYKIGRRSWKSLDFSRVWIFLFQLEEVEMDFTNIPQFLRLSIYNLTEIAERCKEFKKLLDTQSGKLKSLKISCEWNRMIQNHSTDDTYLGFWKHITSACPELKVALHVSTNGPKMKNLVEALPPPRALLSLSIENKRNKVISLKRLLTHLACKGYNRTLEELRIRWTPQIENLDVNDTLKKKWPKLRIF